MRPAPRSRRRSTCAWRSLTSARPPTRVSARVGRQELAFGEQRLVGHVSWANAARTFDAGRVTIRAPRRRVDLFAASVVRILPDAWDRSGNGNRFHGAYASPTAVVPKATVEPVFLLARRSRSGPRPAPPATLRQATTGVRWNGALPARFDYGIETAAPDAGRSAADSIGAWAHHLQVRDAQASGRPLRVTSEYNYASGDENPTDGRRGTFDQLYPTPHDKYGLADQVGWRNIHHVRAGLELGVIKGFPITASYHTWWLASATDGCISPAALSSPALPAGAADRHVGHEFDVQVVARPDAAAAARCRLRPHPVPARSCKAPRRAPRTAPPFLMLTYVFLRGALT